MNGYINSVTSTLLWSGDFNMIIIEPVFDNGNGTTNVLAHVINNNNIEKWKIRLGRRTVILTDKSSLSFILTSLMTNIWF